MPDFFIVAILCIGNFFFVVKNGVGGDRVSTHTTSYRLAMKARFYMLAARKLLFLNSVCKKTEGTSFVTKRLDLKDLDEVIDLVEGFADTL